MLRRNPSPRLGKRAGWAALLAAAVCVTVGGVGPLRSTANAQKFTEIVSENEDEAAVDRLGDPLPDGALARLGTTRMRHASEVTFVAFGPGSKTLLTAGRDNTVRLWDLTSAKEIRRFALPKPIEIKPESDAEKKEEKEKAKAMMMMQGMADGNDRSGPRVALTTNGKTLALACGNVIQLYNVETGAAIRQIQTKTVDILTSLLFSPNGKTLAARDVGNTLFLWESATGKELHQIKPPPRPKSNGFALFVDSDGDGGNAPGMSFTPDGKVLAVATADYSKEGESDSIKFWDVASGKEIRRIKTKVPAGAVAVSPDGALVAYSIGNVLFVCDAKTGKELRQFPPGDSRIIALAFTPDGKTLAVRWRNQRLGLWDVRSGKKRQQLSDGLALQRSSVLTEFLLAGEFFTTAPEKRILAISVDGKRVLAAAGSTVRLWETASGKEVPLLGGHWKTPHTLALSQDGKTVVSWGGDGMVRRWEAATGKPLGAFLAPVGTTRAVLSANGRMVALANADKTIRLHDTATEKELRRLKGHAGGTAALVFSRDGKRLASRGLADNSISLFDVATGRALRRTVMRTPRGTAQTTVLTVEIVGGVVDGSGAGGAGLAFSPDGQFLIAPGPDGGNAGKTLVLFDVESGKELREIALPQVILSVAFSPDGRTLAAENADRTITFWEIASGKKRAALGKPAAELRFNDKGWTVAFNTVDIDGFLHGPAAGPVGLAFSPDGRALAVRGEDRSIRVWDIAAAKEIGHLKGHSGGVETVAFTAGGKMLLSGSTDTTILIWNMTNPLKAMAKPQTIDLTDAEMESLWADLRREDAVKVLRRMRKLIAAPRQSVAFLSRHVKAVERVEARTIQGWIDDLESEKFTVRQEAAARLFKCGDQAIPPLRKVLTASPTLETRKRVEELLDKLTTGILTAEQLRTIRAIEALERIGNAEARRLLRTLASGAPGALPTREAEAALHRLSGK